MQGLPDGSARCWGIGEYCRADSVSTSLGCFLSDTAKYAFACRRPCGSHSPALCAGPSFSRYRVTGFPAPFAAHPRQTCPLSAYYSPLPENCIPRQQSFPANLHLSGISTALCRTFRPAIYHRDCLMPSDRDLLARIGRSSGGRAGYKQLVRELGLGGGRERRLLLEQLARLTARGGLVKADRDHWSLPQAAAVRTNLISGRLDLHRDGFGFVRPTSHIGTSSTPDKGDDIFIPPAELNGAMQGDLVLVELLPPRTQGPNAGKSAGRIVQIAHRRNPTVVGRFRYATSERAPGNYVVPFDERMTQPILIPFGDEVPLYQDADSRSEATPHRVLGDDAHHAEAAHHAPDDLEGLVVDVEITDWPTLHRQARGRILEVLGDSDDFGVDVEIMIRKHHIPHLFPDAVLQNAKDVAHLDQQEIARRHDFRDLPIVTIDGETAKDFDDAVLVRESAGGYELQVHIADVAQYVVPGSPLDLEARLRGTSVYFPDRAVPMLPQELSSDICSLRPAEDRLVLSCIMQLDRHGAILSYEVLEGVIRSARRMTYTQVHQILSGDDATRTEFAP